MDKFFQDSILFIGFYAIAFCVYNSLKNVYLSYRVPQYKYINQDFESDILSSDSEEFLSDDSDDDYVQPSRYTSKLRKRKRN